MRTEQKDGLFSNESCYIPEKIIDIMLKFEILNVDLYYESMIG